jgi:hypothetical protein
VDASGSLVENAPPDAFRDTEYCCGLFHFRRP